MPTVSVDVTAAAPVIAGAADTEHVGNVPDPFDVTAQLRATVPANPLAGVIVMEEIPDVPGEEMLIGLPARVNPGTAVDVTRTELLVVAVTLPEVPVICTV